MVGLAAPALDNLSQHPSDVRGSADIYASNFAELPKVRIGSDFSVARTMVHTCRKSSHSPGTRQCSFHLAVFFTIHSHSIVPGGFEVTS
jgi:hypothetical protein